MSAGPSAEESLVERVLGGEDRELAKLAAGGFLPLDADRVLELQLRLRESEDEEVAALALESLRATHPRLLIGLVPKADAATLRFLCLEVDQPTVTAAVLEKERVEPELLAEMAPRLSPDLQELLLLRQADLVEHPDILDQLEGNPSLSAFSRRRIGEYRQHLVRPSEAPSPPEEAEEDAIATDEEVEEAVRVAAEEVEPEGELDSSTGLSEAQVRSLPVPIRIKLGFGAPKSLRAILIRDHNPLVAINVLKNSGVSDMEIEKIAAQRNVAQEVLSEIAQNRRWLARYGVVVALVKNPRTPQGLAQRLVTRVAVRDLRSVANDLGLSPAVRMLARRTFTVKAG